MQIRKAGLTIATVATGGGTYGFGADYGTMHNIARWGGGRYYQAEGARMGIMEGRFFPEIVSDSPIIMSARRHVWARCSARPRAASCVAASMASAPH
jgi:hypothetical protein